MKPERTLSGESSIPAMDPRGRTQRISSAEAAQARHLATSLTHQRRPAGKRGVMVGTAVAVSAGLALAVVLYLAYTAQPPPQVTIIDETLLNTATTASAAVGITDARPATAEPVAEPTTATPEPGETAEKGVADESSPPSLPPTAAPQETVASEDTAPTQDAGNPSAVAEPQPPAEEEQLDDTADDKNARAGSTKPRRSAARKARSKAKRAASGKARVKHRKGKR